SAYTEFATGSHAAQTATFLALPAQTSHVPGYQCPSDPYYRQLNPWNIAAWWAETATLQNKAMSSYFGVAGDDASQTSCNGCSTSGSPCWCLNYNVGSCHGSHVAAGGSGMFSLRRYQVRIADVTDGTSNTLAVGEARTTNPATGALFIYSVASWMEPFAMT